MALIKCPDCGTKVSERAPTCPKCGGPIAQSGATDSVTTAGSAEPESDVGAVAQGGGRFRRRNLFIALGGVALLVAAIIGGIAYSSAREAERRREEAATAQKAAQEAEARRIEIAEAAKRQALEMEAQAEQARQKSVAAERQRIISHPNSVLEISDLKIFDKGFLNSYRQLTGLSIMNKSKYPIRGLTGKVEWLNDTGAFVGAAPITVTGSIPAGDTKQFSTQEGTLETGTIQGAATRARVVFSTAEIVE